MEHGREQDCHPVGDVCDNCPTDFNADQADCDDDGIGDVCDPESNLVAPFEVWPEEVHFSSSWPGQTYSELVTIANTSGQPVQIASMGVWGPDAFSLEADPAVSCPPGETCPPPCGPAPLLPVGGSCVVEIQFDAPAGTSQLNGVFGVWGPESACGQYSVAVGLYASLASTCEVYASPPTVDFGPVDVGGRVALRIFSVVNAGPGTWQIDFQQPTSGDFSVGPAPWGCPLNTTLTPGTYCQYQATFAPSATGTRTASIEVWTNETGCTRPIVHLVGVGQ